MRWQRLAVSATRRMRTSAANTAMEPHTITHRNVNMPINTLFFSLIVKISSLSLLIVNTKMPWTTLYSGRAHGIISLHICQSSQSYTYDSAPLMWQSAASSDCVPEMRVGIPLEPNSWFLTPSAAFPFFRNSFPNYRYGILMKTAPLSSWLFT